MLSCVTVAMLCLLFGCLMLTGHSSGSKTPKLNIKGKELVIQSGQPFRITCRAEEYIVWKIPAMLENDKKRLRITSNECAGGPKTICRTHLTVSRSHVNDTGLYTCEMSSSVSVQSKSNKRVTSIYIFITEKNHPFVEQNNATRATPVIDGEDIVVPCRTTSPNVTVTLRKTISNKKLSPDGKNIIWDSKRGFILKQPIYDDILSCDATVPQSDDGSAGESVISTHYVMYRISISLRNLNLNVSSNIVLLSGSFIYMKCEVSTDMNARASLDWDYPRLKYGQLLPKTKPIMDRSNPNFILFSSILYIPNVRKIDQGKYVCTASNGPLKKMVQTTVQIHVKPFIKAKTRKQGVFEADAGQKLLNISAKVNAFPLPEIRWLKDGLLAADKFARYTADGYSLIIKDVEEGDAGTYTLSLHTKKTNLTKNVNMRLIVKVRPQIFEKLVPFHESNLYSLGSKQSLTCTVYGVPPPKITWMWQPCPQNHSKSQCDYHIDGSKMSPPVPVILGRNTSNIGNRIQSITQRSQMIEGKNKTAGILVINDSRYSGRYTCVATNEIGTESRDIPYYITDIPNGFHVTLNKEPFEGEDLMLSCSVNKYLYTGIGWTLIRTAGNRTMHHSISKQRDAITAEYSTTLTAIIKNATLADSGTYSCKAKNRYTGEIVRERKEIIIKEEKNSKKTQFTRTFRLKRRKRSLEAGM
uniref:Platelet-derived growth factor receptor-like protein n=1 Tax=Leptobrachium leishanense TaxID=445787 RepID=A0A8C5WEH0_9ANUR